MDGVDPQRTPGQETVARVRAALSEAGPEAGRREDHAALLAWQSRPAVVDLDPSGRVLAANPHALALLHCDGAALAAGLLDRCVTGIRALIRGLDVEPGSSASLSFSLDTAGESARDFRLDVIRFGSPPRFLGFLSDLAVRDVLEADVRLAGQVHELARTYKTIAHELRAPLSAMLVNVDLLHDSIHRSDATDPGRCARQLAWVKVLRQEVSRLNRALHDLLADAGSRIEPSERFDLRGVVRDLAMLISEQARRQGVDVTTGLPVDPLMLLGHRDRLKEAFLNIVVNALQAMPDGGRLIIHVEVEAGHARVAFRDSGPGIPAEIAGQLGETPVTTKVGGSGIGLYVARRLVELNSGRFRIVTGQAKGAIVEIELPLARATG